MVEEAKFFLDKLLEKDFLPNKNGKSLMDLVIELLDADISESNFVTGLDLLMGSVPLFSSVFITGLDETTNRTWYEWFSQKKTELIGDSWKTQKDRTWPEYLYQKKGEIFLTSAGIVTLGISLYGMSLGVQRYNFLTDIERVHDNWFYHLFNTREGPYVSLDKGDILPYALDVAKGLKKKTPEFRETMRLFLSSFKSQHITVTKEELNTILLFLSKNGIHPKKDRLYF